MLTLALSTHKQILNFTFTVSLKICLQNTFSFFGEQLGWAGLSSELLNNYLLDDENSLSSLNISNDPNSSLGHRIKTLGSSSRTLSPLYLHEMAAKSIPNSYESTRLLKLIKTHASDLSVNTHPVY